MTNVARSKRAASQNRYKFEAALSFAGEDRTHAESLFRELKRSGIRVFYDSDSQATLWGKDSREFEKIYSSQTRYVIPFISKSYVRKDWTRFEFDTAKREQKKRRSEFILPVRLDDSRLLGLPDEVVTIDARERSIAQIARLVIEKCRSIRSGNTDNRQRAIRNISINLLAPEARRALGIIAAAAIPLPLKYFEKLLPKYDWRRVIRTLRTAGFIDKNEIFLRLNKSASQVAQADPEERRRSTEAWIDRLRPLRSHTDMAVLLSLHLLTALRFEEAARAAVDIAQYTSLGFWNQAYVALLSRLARRRAFSKMTRRTQLELLNSLGIRLCEAGRHGEALRRFAQLNRLSRKYRNSWGIGQSLINSGVAAGGLCDQAKAEKFNTFAAAHARRSGDRILLGRALSNLAQLLEDRDLSRAESLLEESLRVKAEAGDMQGLAAGSAVRGAFAVARRDFTLAAHWYKESSRAAAHLGLRYEQALSTYNHGRALQDGGKMPAALRLYEKARRLAADDQYGDILVLSLNALGAGAFKIRQYGKVESIAQELLAVAARTKNREYELTACHMLAVCSLIRRGKLQSAAKFSATIKKARAYDAQEWVIRSMIDSTRERTRKGIGSPDLIRLRRMANAEAASRHQNIAAGIWKMVAGVSAFRGKDDDALNAYSAAEKCLSLRPDAIASKLGLYREWFGCAWRARRYEEAIKILRTMEDAARRNGFSADAIAAMDQRGICLQELGKHADAEALHRAAAAEAKKLGSDAQQEGSLNNLGEALRFLGRNEEALRVLDDSEKISRRARRLESAISTSHNRALALEALSRFEEAGRVLRRCQNEAGKHLFWYEHVRAKEGLAHLAWSKGKVVTALNLYRQTMREAHRRGVRALEPRIALNLSRLLSTQKEPKAGLRLLEKFRLQFVQFVDAHLYFPNSRRFVRAMRAPAGGCCGMERGKEPRQDQRRRRC
jgi:tetratricopeptide (TPR) repeat protein